MAFRDLSVASNAPKSNCMTAYIYISLMRTGYFTLEVQRY